ncbi:MAG TPA: hypothetical protein VF174_08765 [Micromonosporaceae bacterium]
MEAVLVALIVAVGGFVGQWLLRRQDYKRQDEVAERVRQVAVTTAENVDKLDDVHKIVNQQRTDMQRYQAVLLAALTAAGVEIPPDESLK